MLYIIRFILKRYCNCEGNDAEKETACCHREMPLWSDGMIKLTGHTVSKPLREVAEFYGKSLLAAEAACTNKDSEIEKQSFLTVCCPGSLFTYLFYRKLSRNMQVQHTME